MKSNQEENSVRIDRRKAMAKAGKYAAFTAAVMVTMLTPQIAFASSQLDAPEAVPDAPGNTPQE